MTFEEAVKYMREGKSVRLGKCTCGYQIPLDGGDLTPVRDHDNFRSYLTVNAALSDEWELCE